MSLPSGKYFSALKTCARYAYAPNSLHFCGPEKQKDLFSYLQDFNPPDRGLSDIMINFETLYPYLMLIAKANNIIDPFDERVVRAYWLGNKLLKNIKPSSYGSHIRDTLNIKKKLKSSSLLKLQDDLQDGLPYHTYHVLNLFIRTGHQAVKHTLKTLDSCRISWGKVVSEIENVSVNKYLISSPRLKYFKDKLLLDIDEQIIVDSPFLKLEAGDMVSVHWNTVADKLDEVSLFNLKKYTDVALNAFNKGRALGRSGLNM